MSEDLQDLLKQSAACVEQELDGPLTPDAVIALED